MSTWARLENIATVLAAAGLVVAGIHYDTWIAPVFAGLLLMLNINYPKQRTDSAGAVELTKETRPHD